MDSIWPITWCPQVWTCGIHHWTCTLPTDGTMDHLGNMHDVYWWPITRAVKMIDRGFYMLEVLAFLDNLNSEWMGKDIMDESQALGLQSACSCHWVMDACVPSQVCLLNFGTTIGARPVYVRNVYMPDTCPHSAHARYMSAICLIWNKTDLPYRGLRSYECHEA